LREEAPALDVHVVEIVEGVIDADAEHRTRAAPVLEDALALDEAADRGLAREVPAKEVDVREGDRTVGPALYRETLGLALAREHVDDVRAEAEERGLNEAPARVPRRDEDDDGEDPDGHPQGREEGASERSANGLERHRCVREDLHPVPSGRETRA